MPNSLCYRKVRRNLRNQPAEDSVEVVGRVTEHAPNEEALDVPKTVDDLNIRTAPLRSQVDQVQQDRIGGGSTPCIEALQERPYLEIVFRYRVHDALEESCSTS